MNSFAAKAAQQRQCTLNILFLIHHSNALKNCYELLHRGIENPDFGGKEFHPGFTTLKWFWCPAQSTESRSMCLLLCCVSVRPSLPLLYLISPSLAAPQVSIFLFVSPLPPGQLCYQLMHCIIIFWPKTIAPR